MCRKGTFGKNVSTLLFGADVSEFEVGILKEPVEKPIKVNAVSTTYVSHRRTSTFNAHLDDCFVILQEVQGTPAERFGKGRGNEVYIKDAKRFTNGFRHVCVGMLGLGRGARSCES